MQHTTINLATMS